MLDYRTKDSAGVSKTLMRAAMGIESWARAIEDVAALTFASRGQLVGFDDNGTTIFTQRHFENQLYIDYKEIGGHNVKVNSRLKAASYFPVGKVIGEAAYKRARRDVVNSDYHDFAMKWDIPFGCQISLLKRRGYQFHFNSLRSKSEGPARESDCQALQEIAPAIVAALELSQSIEDKGHLILANSLDAICIPMILCDETGIVIETTARTIQLFENNGISIVKNRRIVARSQNVASLINTAVHNAIMMQKKQFLIIKNEETGSSTVSLDFSILPREDFNFTSLPKVLITAKQFGCGQSFEKIRSLFDLTDTEAAIVCDLCAGHAREIIAKKRNIAIATIRAHLRNIFSKVGVNREAELIAKISNS